MTVVPSNKDAVSSVNTAQTAIEDMSRELSIDSEEYNLTENPKLIERMSYYQD